MPLRKKHNWNVASRSKTSEKPTLPSDETEMKHIAAKLRAAYVREYRFFTQSISGKPSTFGDAPMPQWDGGEDRSGRTFEPVWPKIARLVKDNKLSPEQFMHVMFLASPAEPPRPNMLHSTQALATYHEVLANETAQLPGRLLSEFAIFKVDAILEQNQLNDANRAWENVLRNTRNGLSPIFRYCVAVGEHMHEVAEIFREAAIEEYRNNPAGYEKYWRTILPPQIRDEVL